MGKVIVQARVMPEKVDTDFNKLKDLLKEVISKHGEFGVAKEVPVAFGLKAIVVSFILEDKDGVMTAVEEEVKTIEGLQSFDVLDLRRAL